MRTALDKGVADTQSPRWYADAARPETTNPKPAEYDRFAQTRWSVVVAASGDSTKARKALEHLCETYWHPLYPYVRREGHGADDAQDLTQEFFARLLKKNWLNAVDSEKGKFRSFLLAAMRHFLVNEWDRANRLKRGGGQRIGRWRESRLSAGRGAFPTLRQPATVRAPVRLQDVRVFVYTHRRSNPQSPRLM